MIKIVSVWSQVLFFVHFTINIHWKLYLRLQAERERVPWADLKAPQDVTILKTTKGTAATGP